MLYLSCNHLVSHWKRALSTTLVPPVKAPCWFPVNNTNIILCSSVHFSSIRGQYTLKPHRVPSGQQSKLKPSYAFLHYMLRWSNKENKIPFLSQYYTFDSESTFCYCMSRDVSSCSVEAEQQTVCSSEGDFMQQKQPLQPSRGHGDLGFWAFHFEKTRVEYEMAFIQLVSRTLNNNTRAEYVSL